MIFFLVFLDLVLVQVQEAAAPCNKTD